jgi:hypothetical protein
MALLIKSLNGLAYASVKSRDGLAVASIKNINGLDVTSGGTPAISYTDTATDATDLTTYTFTARALGSAAADRRIAIAVVGRTGSSTTLAVSTLTVDGVSASLVANTDNTGVNGTTSTYTAIWLASVPSNTTGDVVVTFNGAALRCAISIYRLTGITGTPYDTNKYFNTANSMAAITLDADVTASSVVVAMSGWVGAVSTTTWVGASKDVDSSVETWHYSTAQYTSAGVEAPRTFSATPSVNATDRIGSLAVFN